MLNKPYTIVDVETTGMNGWHDRIIEIGMIRIENNKVVEEFKSLVNPETYISPFIESFTGINSDDLRDAPVFSDIKGKVHELLTDAIFVAHNARFDYSFLKYELKRTGISYNAKTLCTVKLSRNLFSQFRPWPFKGPIQIVEKNEEEELYESFLVNNWCLLNNVQKGYQNSMINSQSDFDMDTYKIISSFIKNRSPNYRVISDDTFKSHQSIY